MASILEEVQHRLQLHHHGTKNIFAATSIIIVAMLLLTNMYTTEKNMAQIISLHEQLEIAEYEKSDAIERLEATLQNYHQSKSYQRYTAKWRHWGDRWYLCDDLRKLS